MTFPEQYGVRIGKGAMPTALAGADAALWGAATVPACRTLQRAKSFRAVQPASRHRAVAQCTLSSPRCIRSACCRAGTPFPYVIMQRHLLMRPTMPTFHEWYARLAPPNYSVLPYERQLGTIHYCTKDGGG